MRRLRVSKGVKKRLLRWLSWVLVSAGVYAYLWQLGPMTPSKYSNLFWIGLDAAVLLALGGYLYVQGYRQARAAVRTLAANLERLGLPREEARAVALGYIAEPDAEKASQLLFSYALGKIAEKKVGELIEREKDALIVTLQRRLELELGMPIEDLREIIQSIKNGNLKGGKKAKTKKVKVAAAVKSNGGTATVDTCPKCGAPLITLLDGSKFCPRCRAVFSD